MSMVRILHTTMVGLVLVACARQPVPPTAVTPAALGTVAPTAPLATTMPTPTEAATRWPIPDWQTSTPEAQGMDSGQLAKMLAFLQQEQANVHNLLIVRHGLVVAEAAFYPNRADTPHDI